MSNLHTTSRCGTSALPPTDIADLLKLINFFPLCLLSSIVIIA
jgi:hypothetical protein